MQAFRLGLGTADSRDSEEGSSNSQDSIGGTGASGGGGGAAPGEPDSGKKRQFTVTSDMGVAMCKRIGAR